MGGGGNQKWGGYTEPAKITEPIPSVGKEPEGVLEGYDIGGIPKRGPRGSKEPKKEIYKSPETLAREQAEREKRADLKTMNLEEKVERKATEKMFYKSIEKEFHKWEKSDGANYQEWVNKLETFKKEWTKGGKERWIKSNPRLAHSIRDKIRRDIQWNRDKKNVVI